MWSWKAKTEKPEITEAPEKLRYSKYYEHDGMLRAYANRAMLLAFVCVPTTLIALGFAIYVRIQPPTVIRVDQNGEAAVVGHNAKPSALLTVSVAQGSDAEPTDFERRAFVRSFLEHYLNFSPATVANNWSESLNMMTSNLRRLTMSGLRADNTIGKIQEDQMTSVVHLRMIDEAKDDPLSFTVYGVKEVHRVRDHKEDVDRIVGEYDIRLISERRSEQNPSGLLVAEYAERAIEGEKRDAILHEGAPLGAQ